ncbi:uncharacterized protein LOC134705585 [Mytilus trossulus]|uniref:uncharacterized protein LOC134705585 n=1 Tax=Mytilus trossulus TaxID=6551 RepID=UPI003007DAA3
MTCTARTHPKFYDSRTCGIISVLGILCHLIGITVPYWYYERHVTPYGLETYYYGLWKGCSVIPGLQDKCFNHDAAQKPYIHIAQVLSVAGLLMYFLGVLTIIVKIYLLKERTCCLLISAGFLSIAGFLCLSGLMIWIISMPGFFISEYLGWSFLLEVVSVVLAIAASAVITQGNISQCKTNIRASCIT